MTLKLLFLDIDGVCNSEAEPEPSNLIKVSSYRWLDADLCRIWGY